MAAKWLFSVDTEGVRLTHEFAERLKSGDKTALRTLFTQKLTHLYLKGHTRAPRRNDAHGLFWSDIPDTALIPLVRAGRHSPPAWIKREVLVETDKPKKNTYHPPKALAQNQRAMIAHVKSVHKGMKRGEETVFMKIDGRAVRAWNMIPNPKFDLVVVNRHDKAALLKMLSELDSAANIEPWLTDRTTRTGATVATHLHADYSSWCNQRGEAPAGTKTFGQALVAAGVVKLARGNAGERYQLELL